MIDSSLAARLLRTEAAAVRRVLARAPATAFALPTACAPWTVRDVLAHCSAALRRVIADDLGTFTPAENQADVDARAGWPLELLLDELFTGFEPAAEAIAAAGGRFDGVALGVWVHGGDVRDPLDEPDPYTHAGVDLALELLERRSARLPVRVLADLPDRVLHLGTGDAVTGRVVTDVETLVRLLAGRRPDPARYDLDGVEPGDLVLFG